MTSETKKTLAITTLTISIVFFVLGMYFPLLSTYKQLIIKFDYQEMNIFQSIEMFFVAGEYFLASIILVFTFIVPVVEYIGLVFRIMFNKKTGKVLQNLDKWNMLDVFLVALLLLNFKMNSIFIVMQLKVGTTFIAIAVIFRILTVMLINRKSA